MKTQTVRTGIAHTCAGCGNPIPAGALASRSSRRAETHRERCHADKHGDVNWYRHTQCAAAKAIEAGDV